MIAVFPTVSVFGFGMQRTIYGFILKHSLPQQVILVVLTFLALPFIYLQAEVPKLIVNDAISASAENFPVEFLGMTFDQVSYLFVLCGVFLFFVLINGAFKYFLNVFRGRLGERMLRRLRYELYARILRFPQSHFRRIGQGELIPIVTQEVEPLGGFIGDSIAQPLYQGGILITLLLFIMVQDPMMGLAAISLFPLQAILVPRLQKRVNALGKMRVQNVRHLSHHLGESISGVVEINTNDNAKYQLAKFSSRLGIIYEIRYEIFRRKFFIKFFNNFLAQFTPFMFYAIGGYLAIEGSMSVGALVAVISAHKDMNAPWKELLAFYQRREDARIKYGQVIEQFDPAGMAEPIESEDPITPIDPDALLEFKGIGLSDEDGTTYLSGSSFEFRIGDKVCLTGASGSGKEVVAPLLARVMHPTTGRITLDGKDLTEIPDAVLGSRIGYVGGQPFVFSGTVKGNLLLAIQQRPSVQPGSGMTAWAVEASKAGNSTDDVDDEWIGHGDSGLNDAEALNEAISSALRAVMLYNDIYELGIRGRYTAQPTQDVTDKLLQARQEIRHEIDDGKLSGLVEPFDPEAYNKNATVAENLLFGTPVGDAFKWSSLADHVYVQKILNSAGLTETFLEIGAQVAETMVDLFADLDANHSLMDQYSFISADELPEFQSIMNRIKRDGLDSLPQSEKLRLQSLAFNLAPERHRLGLIDQDTQNRILTARQLFRASLPAELAASITFFDPEQLNLQSSIQDNVLFGKVVYGRPQAEASVRASMGEVLSGFGLTQEIVNVGLNFDVGVSGSRLSAIQRQKLAIARAMLKRPDMLVLNNPFGPFDNDLREEMIHSIINNSKGGGVLAVLDQMPENLQFDVVLAAHDGYISAQAIEEREPENSQTHED